MCAADAGSPLPAPADGSAQQPGLDPSTPCWAYWDGQQQQVCSPHYFADALCVMTQICNASCHNDARSMYCMVLQWDAGCTAWCYIDARCIAWCYHNAGCIAWCCIDIGCTAWCYSDAGCTAWCYSDAGCTAWCYIYAGCTAWCYSDARRTAWCYNDIGSTA